MFEKLMRKKYFEKKLYIKNNNSKEELVNNDSTLLELIGLHNKIIICFNGDVIVKLDGVL